MKTVPAALLALGMLAPALAQDVDRDDVPRQCESVCANIVAVSDQCDRQFNRDRDELDCMCRAENAQQVVPLCAACIDFYDTDDDNDDNDVEDNDAGDLRRECGFAQTSFDPSSTYNVPQMTAATNLGTGSSGTAGPTPTTNQASLSSALNSLSSSLATATTTDQASLSSVVQSISSNLASSASSAAGAVNTDNAAVQKEGAQAAIAGAALLAAAALL